MDSLLTVNYGISSVTPLMRMRRVSTPEGDLLFPRLRNCVLFDRFGKSTSGREDGHAYFPLQTPGQCMAEFKSMTVLSI